MTIQEAIKSGKPFRRKDDAEYLSWSGFGSATHLSLSIESIIADDWEIKQEPREMYLAKGKGGLLQSWYELDIGRLADLKPGIDFIKVREVIE